MLVARQAKRGGCKNQIVGLAAIEGPGLDHQSNAQDGMVEGDVGRCEDESGPVKDKFKRKKKEKTKKKGIRGNRKKRELHVQEQALIVEQIPENVNENLNSATQSLGGVVRNPLGQFQPSSSASISFTATASHVESIGDSGVEMGNNRFDTKMESIKAKKLWKLATEKLGVTADDEDEDEMFIERLRAMEEKAQAAKGKKGKSKGAK